MNKLQISQKHLDILLPFVMSERDKGIDTQLVHDALVSVGWSSDIVKSVFRYSDAADAVAIESIKDFINREISRGVSVHEIDLLLVDSPWPKRLIEKAKHLSSHTANNKNTDRRVQVSSKAITQTSLAQRLRSRHFYTDRLKKIEKDSSQIQQLKKEQQQLQDRVDQLSKEVVSSAQRTHFGAYSQQDDNAIHKHVASSKDTPSPSSQHAPESESKIYKANRSKHSPTASHVSATTHATPSSVMDKADELDNNESPAISSQGYEPVVHHSEQKAKNNQPTNMVVEAQQVRVTGSQATDDLLVKNKLDLLEQRYKNFMTKNPADQMTEFHNPLILDELTLAKEPVGDRAPSGVVGFDAVIEGGLKRRTTTLIAGGPGSGKTTLGLQYLYNGAIQFQEAGVYITFEQQPQQLLEMGAMFGWDMQALVANRLIAVRELTPEQLDKMLKSGGGSLRDLIESMGASRVVIDSVTAYILLHEGEIAQRRACLELFHNLSKWNCTTMVIAEEEHKSGVHTSSVLEYETDGVVILYNERRGDVRQRSMEIFKMRGTKHAGRIFPMKLTPGGLEVYPQQITR